MGLWSELKSRLAGSRNSAPDSEAGWSVSVSDTQVVCTRSDGRVESVAWDDLKEVVIVTTDEGPFAPDVFWLLAGEQGGCAVPQGAAGEETLLERLQALPGFDNEAVIKAMSSVENEGFVCWKKEPAT